MVDKKRIVKNTILLYLRMLLTLVISLYTSRIVLQTLGVIDFGVYNVVGGVVILFTFFSAPLAHSTRRFLMYELGTGNQTRLQKIMSSSIVIHIVFALVVVLLTEAIGRWFVINVLQIPPLRLDAALYVLHFSAISIFLSIITLPFTSDVIAHEQMDVFAIVSIGEALLKLLIVSVLVVADVDKLVLYTFLLILLQMFSFLSYFIYCRCKFHEARCGFKADRGVVRELLSFFGWTMTGGLSGICNGQGLNMLLNVFYGPAVNAARGIAVQVQTVTFNFCQNIQDAINPQITKTYASGDYDNMHKLIAAGSKLTFIFLLMIILPILFNTEYILTLWLGDYPNYTVDFIRLILIVYLIDILSSPLITANHATGNIKKFQIVVESVNIMTLPISYILLRLNPEFSPIVVYIVLLIIAIVAQVIRIIIVLPNIKMRFGYYFKSILQPLIEVGLLSVSCSFLFYHYATFDKLLTLLIGSFLSTVIIFLLSIYIVLNSDERKSIRNNLVEKSKTFLKGGIH